MALVKCKNCNFKTAIGFMPTTTFGLFLIPGMVFGFFLSTTVLAGILKTYHLFYKILLGIVLFTAGSIAGLLAILYIPWTLEWLYVMRLKCPDCGHRKWTYPFTEGFGL